MIACSYEPAVATFVAVVDKNVRLSHRYQITGVVQIRNSRVGRSTGDFIYWPHMLGSNVLKKVAGKHGTYWREH